jgi:hypothetical protein
MQRPYINKKKSKLFLLLSYVQYILHVSHFCGFTVIVFKLQTTPFFSEVIRTAKNKKQTTGVMT